MVVDRSPIIIQKTVLNPDFQQPQISSDELISLVNIWTTCRWTNHTIYVFPAVADARMPANGNAHVLGASYVHT